MNSSYPDDKAVLLFDGVCYTCNAIVDAIIRSDKSDRFRFAPLQSVRGQKILTEIGLPFDKEMKTMVLIASGKTYRFSSAYFEICRLLGGGWKLGLIFSILPRAFTDWVYLVYSKRRHVFGRRTTCRLPTTKESAKFFS